LGLLNNKKMRLAISATPSNTPSNTPPVTPSSSNCPGGVTPTPTSTSMTPTPTTTNTSTPTNTPTYTPTPSPTSGATVGHFLLQEDGNLILQEDGFAILLDSGSPLPSPTNTSTPTSTPTPTPTNGTVEYDVYTADEYSCPGCTVLSSGVLVAFPAGQSVTIGRWYPDEGDTSHTYLITGTSTGAGYILTNIFGSFTSCGAACAI
jgi:hypothetical protein